MSNKSSKLDRNNGDLETLFEDVLFNCEQILSADREDLFEFLDPIISDSQCHIHSLFIISKLLQICQKNGSVGYKSINNLPHMDRTLLSYVVLFSTLKFEEVDEVGFVKISQLIDYLGILFGRVNAERKTINQLKGTFNSHSIKHLIDITSGKVKRVLEECDAKLNSKKLQLQLQPCYATFYAMFKYMEVKQLPIIVPLVRFSAEMSGPDSKLRITSKSLLYFQFNKSKTSFVFKSNRNLSEEEKAQPTIVITCFSVVNNSVPEYFKEYMEGSQLPSDKFLTEDCDIRELILLSAAGHIQLTDRFHVKEQNRTEEYVKELYKKHSNLCMEPRSTPFTGNFDLIEDNIYGCYHHHYEMAEKFGIANARYTYRSKSVDDSDVSDSSVLVIRRNENTFFKFDHVNVSTFDRECDRMNSFMVGAEVPLIEPENFSKTEARTHVKSKLAKLQSLIKSV